MSTDTAFNRHCRRKLRRLSGHLVHRRQNLQILATFAALVALVLLLNLTPVPGWVCSFIELEPDVPADLLGEAYWDDCFGALWRFRRRSLPRPEHLSYAPRPTSSSPNWKSSPAQEEAIEAAEAEQAAAEQSEKES